MIALVVLAHAALLPASRTSATGAHEHSASGKVAGSVARRFSDGRYRCGLVKDGKQQIWLRALDSADMTPLAGTEKAADPFWSPDSRFLAFFADARLKKIERSGGPVQTICDALGAMGGTWNRKGTILIGALSRPQTVSDAGGPVADLPGQQ